MIKKHLSYISDGILPVIIAVFCSVCGLLAMTMLYAWFCNDPVQAKIFLGVLSGLTLLAYIVGRVRNNK